VQLELFSSVIILWRCEQTIIVAQLCVDENRKKGCESVYCDNPLHCYSTYTFPLLASTATYLNVPLL